MLSCTVSRPLVRFPAQYGIGFCSIRGNTGVRVRFAPSPTGFMHIGGLRTALINKMFALKQNGKFILRIEDTDRTRFHPEALQDIVRSLQWSGLTFDEGPGVGGDYGPYFQSERKSLYAAAVSRLIESGQAYPCFCSAERLELLRNEQRRRKENPRYDNRCRSMAPSEAERRIQQGDPYTVRLKVPHAKVTVDDLVFGSVEFETQDSEGDFILLKSDGMPVYHLANVVDDHHMEITHVIRGAEWLSSTPKHVLLYGALNWKPPAFAHLPLLLSSTGGKLSKRSPEFAQIGQVRSLIQAGFLPSAVLTWLSSVGTRSQQHSPADAFRESDRWGPQMQMPDLIARFDLGSISRQNVTISADTLHLCGRVHFDRLATEALNQCRQNSLRDESRTPELIARVRQYFEANLPGFQPPERTTTEDDLRMAVQLHGLQGRISCFADLLDGKQKLGFLWQPVDLQTCSNQIEKSIIPFVDPNAVVSFILQFAEDLHRISCTTPTTLDTDVGKAISLHCAELGLKKPVAMRLLRICLSGRETGIPIVELIHLLTPEKSAARLRTVGIHLRGEKATG